MTEIAVWVLWLLINGTWTELPAKYPDLATCERSVKVWVEQYKATDHVCTNNT